jgi:hypothetical protein
MNRVFQREPLILALAVVMLALFVVCVLLAAVDPRLITGVNAWFKPAKFTLSVAIYLFTVACILSPLERGLPGLAAARRTVAVAMAGEIAIILLQAARGVPSHFNNSTPLNGVLFAVMGILILANTLAAAWILWLYLRDGPALQAPLLLGIRLGLGIFVVAGLQGFLMVANGAHSVGAPDGARGIFFVNWSLAHGDLRIAHFLGLHSLQGLPVVAWLSESRKVVIGVAAGWALVFLLTLAVALFGRPLLTAPAG